MDSYGKALAAISSLSLILLFPPLIFHVKKRNIPTICLLTFLCLESINSLIGASVWSGDDFYTKWDGKGYCDVFQKIKAGSSTGKIAAVAALSLDIYMILRAKNHKYLVRGSKVKIAVELSICLVPPAFCMVTNYIIQTSRFVIVRYVGCYGFYSGSILTLFLVSFWNLLWAVFAVVLVLLTLFTYSQRRRDVKDLLQCTDSGLNMRRFVRILIFIALVITILVPMVVYYFVRDAEFYHGPYSWKFTNQYFNYAIEFYSASPDITVSVWLNFGICIISFLLFGLGEDAIKMYKAVIPQNVLDKYSANVVKEQVLVAPDTGLYESAGTGTTYCTTISRDIYMKDEFASVELDSFQTDVSKEKDLEAILREVEQSMDQ